MNNEKVYKYYRLIKFNVQLEDVALVEMECHQNEEFFEGSPPLRVTIGHRSELIDEEVVDIYVKVTLAFEEKGPFYISTTYKGKCLKNVESDISTEVFEEQALSQAVPLLLPYIRECMSNTVTRMGYSPFYLPTLDILNSLAVNTDIPEE